MNAGRQGLLIFGSAVALALSVVGGAAAGSDTQSSVRFVSKTSRVTQGGTVRAVIAVRPLSVRCTGILERGSAGVARAARAVGGRAAFAWRLPATSAVGRWSLTVSCGVAGKASAPVDVLRKPQVSPPAREPARILVNKNGFAVDEGFSYRSLGYGVVLQNASPDEDAWDVDVTVNAVDGSNRVVESDSTTIDLIPASATYYLGGDMLLDAPETAARLEIVTSIGTRKPRVAVTLPRTANVRALNSPYDGVAVEGEVSNPYTKPLSSLSRINVVLFASDGGVISGGYTYVDADVPPGARIGFRLSVYGVGDAARVASIGASVEPRVA